MKTICQTEEPAVASISDCGLRIAERKSVISELKGRNCLSEIRNPQSEIRNRSLPQSVIAEHQRGHCLNDRHRARQDTRIMASTSGQRGFLARGSDRFLIARNRRGRFESDPEKDVLAIA